MEPIRTFNVHYTPDVMKRAVRAFCARQIGLPFVLMLAFLASRVVYLLFVGDRSWALGVLGSIVVFGVMTASALYLTHMRRVKDVLLKLGGADVIISMQSDGMSFASAPIGEIKLAWADISRLTRRTDFWLLHYKRGSYSTLPIAGLDPTSLAYIEEHVLLAGGKVA